jgi:hypothetical protein
LPGNYISNELNTEASSYNKSPQEKDLDNMRGFDPASEDDMDDNGMQRYFDANDEETWRSHCDFHVFSATKLKVFP